MKVMNRETCINGNKTILNTDFYLYLLEQEIKNNKKQKAIDDIKEYCKDDNEYWGNEDYTIGKNEENKKVRNDILEILERESEE